MEVWPPEKLIENVWPIIVIILWSPILIFLIIYGMIKRFLDLQTITLNELGSFAGIIILSIIALVGIGYFFYNIYTTATEEKKYDSEINRIGDIIGYTLMGLIGGYIPFAIAAYFILKLFM